MSAKGVDVYAELEDGTRWPCLDGGVIGRAGSVASDQFQRMLTLSRRHFSFSRRESTWFVTLMPEARNRTWFDGREMERGIAFRISGRHEIRVGASVFWLETSFAADRRHQETEASYLDETIAGPRPASAQASASAPPSAATSNLSSASTRVETADDRDRNRDGDGSTELRPGAVGASSGLEDLIAESGAALLALDDQLTCIWSTRKARALLGLQGDTYLPQRFLDVVHPPDAGLLETTLGALLKDGGQEQLRFRLRGQPERRPLSLTARGQHRQLMLTLRTDSRDEVLAQRIVELNRLMASPELAGMTRNEGLTHLTAKLREILECQRAGLWLKTEDETLLLRCGGAHDSGAVRTNGHGNGDGACDIIDVAYCPEFFEALMRTDACLEETSDGPVLGLLAELGVTSDETGAALMVPIKSGLGFLGFLALERDHGLEPWTVGDRIVAQCAGGVCQLVLLNALHRETGDRLVKNETRLHRHLEDLRRHVHARLPEPLSHHRVTGEWKFQPANDLGGDFFGHHWLDDQSLAVYMVDVNAHGAAAALLASAVVESIREEALDSVDYHDPASVLAGIQRRFTRHAKRASRISPNSQFPILNSEFPHPPSLSCWYGVCHVGRGEIAYASAGAPAALLLFGDMDTDTDPDANTGPETGVGDLDYQELHSPHTPAITADPDRDPSSAYTTARATFGNRPAKLILVSDGAFDVPITQDRHWTFEEFTAAARSTLPMDSGETHYLLLRAQTLHGQDTLPSDATLLCLRFNFEV